MSRTTFQIGAILTSEYPGKPIEHLSNYAVKGTDAVKKMIAGVMVCYQVTDQVVRWCYI